MGTPEDADREAERFFEEHWRKGDAWSFDASPWETTRLDRLRDEGLGPVWLENAAVAGH